MGSAAALLCLVVLVSRAGPVVSYPQRLECDRSINPGSMIMGSPVVVGTRTVRLAHADGNSIECGASLAPNTQYMVVVSDTTGQFLVETEAHFHIDASVTPNGFGLFSSDPTKKKCEGWDHGKSAIVDRVTVDDDATTLSFSTGSSTTRMYTLKLRAAYATVWGPVSVTADCEYHSAVPGPPPPPPIMPPPSPCPPGKFSNEGMCTVCPMDTFNAVPGAESCIACPGLGTTSTMGIEGATSVAACRSTGIFSPDSLPRSQSLGGGAEIKW